MLESIIDKSEASDPELGERIRGVVCSLLFKSNVMLDPASALTQGVVGRLTNNIL
jgi:hypothetical protein